MINSIYPKVSIIILNWNGKDDTVECLNSLNFITYPNYNIIIVDNGSTDDSVEYIKKYFPNIEIIRNEKNLGFCEGNNIGIRYALNYGTDYILLLNNDTVVDPNFLTELIKVAENDGKIGLVQSKLLYYDDKTINSTGFLLDIFGFTIHRGRFEKDRFQYDHLLEKGFFYASGACILITKKILIEFSNNIFDKDLFAYHEDVDLSWVIRLLGYKIIYCPKSICYHKEGKTSGRYNTRTAYWVYRNRIRVLIKNYSFRNVMLILPITILLELLHSIISSISKKNPNYIIAFFKGIFWNIKNLKNTLIMRDSIQSKRKIDDSIITSYMVWYPLEFKYMIDKLINSKYINYYYKLS